MSVQSVKMGNEWIVVHGERSVKEASWYQHNVMSAKAFRGGRCSG